MTRARSSSRRARAIAFAVVASTSVVVASAPWLGCYSEDELEARDKRAVDPPIIYQVAEAGMQPPLSDAAGFPPPPPDASSSGGTDARADTGTIPDGASDAASDGG